MNSGIVLQNVVGFEVHKRCPFGSRSGGGQVGGRMSGVLQELFNTCSLIKQISFFYKENEKAQTFDVSAC